MPNAVPNFKFKGVFNATEMHIDDAYQKLVFKAENQDYETVRNVRKKLEELGIKLTGTFKYKDEQRNDNTWILSLPSMQLWQKYRLAEKFELKNKERPEVSATENLLEFADDIVHPIENIPEGLTAANIVLGVPLENANKQQAVDLAIKQKEFWQRIFEDAKNNEIYSEIKKQIFYVIHEYLNNTKRLTIRHSRVLKELYDLIITTKDADLWQELQNFLTDKKRFQTGVLGRSVLRKNILAIFNKAKKINCKKLDKLTDADVIEFLKQLPHNTHLSRKQYYKIGTKVIKFSHTIEVAAKDLDNPDSEKNYFVHKSKKRIVGTGSFSIVKLLSFSFSFQNSKIKIDKKPWVVKKYRKKEELNQSNLRDTEILERFANNESHITKDCSPSLESHRLFRGKNRFKLFMRNAGEALYNNKGRLDFSPIQLAKIFYDITTEIIELQEKGYFLWDIKPENMVFDEIRGRLIDHGGTRQKDLHYHDEQGRLRIPFGSLTLEYLDPPLGEEVKNRKGYVLRIPGIAERHMVFSVGLSLSHMFKQGDEAFEVLKNLANNMQGYFGRKNLATLQAEFAEICKTDKIFELDIFIIKTKKLINNPDIVMSLKPLRIKLLEAIEAYLRSCNQLSDKRAKNCRALIYMIADIKLNTHELLFSQMHKFLQDRKHVGLLRQSKLRKLIFNVFHEEFDAEIEKAKEFFVSNRDAFSEVRTSELDRLFKQSATSNINNKHQSLERIKNKFYFWIKESIEQSTIKDELKNILFNDINENCIDIDITTCISYSKLIKVIRETQIDELIVRLKELFQQHNFSDNLKIHLLEEIEKKPLLVESINRILNGWRTDPDCDPKQSVLLDMIAKNLRNLGNLNYKDVKAYYNLVVLIRDTDLEQLPGQLERIQEFPQPKLIENIKELLQPKIVAVDPRRLNDLDVETQQAVLFLLAVLGTKLKRGMIFRSANRAYFFSRSVEVVKQEEHSQPRSFFIPSRKFDTKALTGNFGSVKPVERFTLADTNLVYDSNSWIVKKQQFQERSDFDVVYESLNNEYQYTKRTAPKLAIHCPVIVDKKCKSKLFMRNAGQDLDQFPKDLLNRERVAKILKDVTEQAQLALSQKIFLSDIKPKNIVYDYKKNKATIIDLDPDCYTLGFVAPELFLPGGKSVLKDDKGQSKAMVYAIGISLHEIVKNQVFSGDFTEIIERMTKESPEERALLEEVIEFAIRIIKEASPFENTGRPGEQENSDINSRNNSSDQLTIGSAEESPKSLSSSLSP